MDTIESDIEYNQKKYNINDELIIEISNFFPSPQKIAEYFFTEEKKCLIGSANFFDPDDPGYKYDLDPKTPEEYLIINAIVEKIEYTVLKKVKEIKVSFCMNSKNSLHGCIHVDGFDVENIKNKYSGVVYMSQNFPVNCGTTIYNYNDLTTILKSFNFSVEEYLELTHVVNTMFLPERNFVKRRCSEQAKAIMNKFEQFKKIDYVFNKFIAYPMYVLHSQDNYFGDSDAPIDSRLTFSVFFELDETELPDFLKSNI